MLSAMVPTIDSTIHAEPCPAIKGIPKAINTIPNIQNSLDTARLYFLRSTTSNISALAQNPIGTDFFENHARTPQHTNIPPQMHHIIKPIILPSIPNASIPISIYRLNSNISPRQMQDLCRNQIRLWKAARPDEAKFDFLASPPCNFPAAVLYYISLKTANIMPVYRLRERHGYYL